MDKRTRRTFLAAATLLAPALMVQGVRWTFGWHPAAVVAAPVEQVAPPPGQPTLRPATVEQKRLSEWVQERTRAIASAPSPMDAIPQPETAPPVIVPDQPVLTVPNAVATKPNGELRLGGFMGQGDAALIMINGKVLRIGDEIEPGWRVTAIDAAKFSVELTGPEQVVFVLVRER